MPEAPVSNVLVPKILVSNMPVPKIPVSKAPVKAKDIPTKPVSISQDPKAAAAPGLKPNRKGSGKGGSLPNFFVQSMDLELRSSHFISAVLI